MTTGSPGDQARIYRRVLRRETHSSKAGLAIAVAVVLILALAYVAAECVLALLRLPPLLVAPKAALLAVVALPATVASATLIAVGSVVAFFGLVILIAALTPGRRLDHLAKPGRTAVAVDNRAVASAIAYRASSAAGIDPDQVVVTVGRRVADVRLQPTSGWPIDRPAVEAAVSQEITRMDLTPALRQSVTISTSGVVGA
jgi:hypothetical protein